MIKIDSEPVAGEDFKFEIYPEDTSVVWHNVSASIDNNLLYVKMIDCDDPPCHEMLHIPNQYTDKTLTINYTNNLGYEETFDFIIQSNYLNR